MNPTRRDFLKGSAMMLAATGLRLRIPDVDGEPVSVALWDLGSREKEVARLPLASVVRIHDENGWHWDAADVTFVAFVGMIEQIAVLDSDDRPLHVFDFVFTGSGGDITIIWHAEGIGRAPWG